MGYFPGNIMIIDDQFDIVHQSEPTEREQQIQYNSFRDLKIFCEDNGIPLISISSTTDTDQLQSRINKYQNVRLLIIDLDLNNDQQVNPEDDYETIYLILRTAIAKYGYFLLLINSAHSEAWENIKQSLPADINSRLIQNFSDVFQKGDRNAFFNKITELITNNFSLELIYNFETELNSARDRVLGSFIDFSKATWENVMFNLRQDFDSTVHLNFTLTQYLLGLIKQFLINIPYAEVTEQPEEHDAELLKEIARGFNYISNSKEYLKDHPIWTGNLYKCNICNIDQKYLLVITPECDLAQGKVFKHKVIYGFEVNETTFPAAYAPGNFEGSETPPVLVKKFGKDKAGKWKKRQDINAFIGQPQHLYFLPYASENSRHIYLDFRESGSIDDLASAKYVLISRVNEPLITDISDKYSTIFNRKGIPNFLPKKKTLD